MLLRQNFTKFFSSIALLSLLPELAFALPEGASVESGSVEVSSKKSSMELKVSDKAIINYDSFSIGKKEKVKFFQPSSSSVALNRVRGKNASEILGKLESNGRIFLINPHGVFFGPSAQVNVGSIVVSTLDLASSDFLKDNYRFTLSEGAKASKIINQGSITAEGSIALLAPIIQNEGMIEAKSGSVLLASAEKVTLDFTGDGLLSFSVEGELEEAIIRQSAEIKASKGDVFLKLKVADKAIKAVVNTDGVEEGEVFIEENGVIKLVSSSSIQATKIEVDGGVSSFVDVQGSLDATSSKGVGGRIAIIGERVETLKASVDASGKKGGGEIFIGGDYKGGKNLFKAINITLDQDTLISADATYSGDGGRIILWSEGNLSLSSIISAQGGPHSGNGGFVETSGKVNLEITNSYKMRLSSPKGYVGTWLIDPSIITISASGVDPYTGVCTTGSSVVISPSTLDAAGATVILCGDAGITVNDPITLTTSAAGIIFQANPGSTIDTTLNASVSTTQGPIFFSKNTTGVNNVVLGANVTLSTGTGAPITFEGNISGAYNLTLGAGTSTVTFASASSINIGASAAAISLDITQQIPLNLLTSSVALLGGLRVRNTGATPLSVATPSTFSVGGSVTIGGFQSGGGAYNVTLGGGGAISGAVSFANSGIITLSGAGSSLSIASALNTTSGSSTHYSGSIAVTGGGNTITSNVIVLDANTSLSTANSVITLGGNISGAYDLAINCGTAILSIGGGVVTSIGASSSTISLDVISATPTLSLGSSTTLAGGLRIRNAALTATNIGVPGPLTVPGPITVGGIATAGSAFAISITGGGTISGVTNFLNTGQLSLGGVSGSDLNFSSNLSVTAPSQLNLSGTLNFASAAAPTINVPTNLALDTTITTVNTNIALNGNVFGAQNLALYTPAGTTVMGSGVSISIGDAAGNISLNVRSNATFSTNGPVTLVGGLKVTTNGMIPQDFGAGSTLIVGGEISVGGFLTGAGAFNISLIGGGTISGSINLLNTGITTLHGGTPNLSLFSNLSTTTASSTHISGTILQNDSAETITMGTVVLDGNATLQTNNGVITINGASITGAHNLVLNPGSSNVSIGGGVSINIGDIPGNTSLTINDNNLAIGFNALTLAGGLTVTTSVPGPQHVVFQATTSIGGAINVGALDTTAAPFDLFLLGGGSIDGVTTIANTGEITLYGGTPNLTLAAPIDTSSTSVTNISGQIIVTTASDSITMPVVVLDGDAVLATNNGAINLTGTVDGAHALNINAGTANAVFNAPLGATTPLASLSATGGQIIQNATAETLGAISYTPGTVLFINGNITTAGGGVTVSGPTLLASSATIDTTNTAPAGATITLQTVNAFVAGAQGATLIAGTGGDITLGVVGGTTAFGALTITSAHSVIINNITTEGGIVSIAPPVTLAASSVIDTTNATASTGANINLGTTNATTASTFAESLTLNAGSTGAISIGSAGVTNPLGFFDVSAASGVTTAGNIIVRGDSLAGGTISISSPITLAATTSFNTTGASATAGGSIIISSVDGGEVLSIDAGSSGTAQFGAIGGVTPLTNLTVTGANVFQISTARTVGFVSYTGNTQIGIGGNLTTDAGPVTWNNPATIAVDVVVDTTNGGATPAGANIILSDLDAFTNSTAAQHLTLNAGSAGVITIGTVGAALPLGLLAITGGIGVNANGNITIRGNATGGGTLSISQPVTLGGTVTFTTTGSGAAAGANIVLGNVNATTASVSAEHLTLNAGTGGAVTLGTVGGSTPLGLLTISNATGVTAGGSITIRGNATAGGTISIAQPITLTGSATFATTGGGVTAGNNITLGTVNGAHVFALNAGTSGTAQFGAIGGSTPLTSLAATGATVAQTSTVRTTGAITYTAPTLINIGGNLTTGGGIVTWNNPAVLTTTLSVDTTNGGGAAAGANIVLGNVNATTSSIAAQQLTLNAGSGGAVTLGTVGGSTPLGLLTISNATGVTATGNITIRGDATGGGTISIAQPITLTGPATFSTTGGGVAAGDNITLGRVNGAQVFAINAGSGGIAQFGAIGGSTPLTSLTATGATVNQTSTVTTTGAITYTGPTAININGDLTTAGGIVTWNNPATLATTLTVDTTNAGANTAGANIVLGNVNATLASASAEQLTLLAGTGGAVTLGTVGGSTPLGLLTITGGTSVTAGGSITIRGDATGGGTISIAQPITLTGPATFSTTGGGVAAGDNITLGRVNGAQVFAINAGSGGIAQFGAIGGSTPLTSLTATGATVNQTSTVTTTGAITYTGPTAININGDLTTAGGIVTWNNPATLATTLTIDTTNAGGTTAGANIVLGSVNATTASASAEQLTLLAGSGGAVTLGTIGGSVPLGLLTITGGTSITAGGSITIRGDATGGGTISIAQPITLTGAATFATTGGGVTAGNNITLGTVNGAQVFAIDAGTAGTAQFGAIGGSTPPTSLTATGATVNQTSTVRTTGPITYTGTSAINVSGNLTTAGGIVTWNNPALLTTSLTVDATNGGGAAAGANIVLGNVNATSATTSAETLTLNAGSGGAVTLGVIGGSTPLGLLSITGATAVTATGNIAIRGDATAGGTLSIAQPVILTGAAIFTTTGGGVTAGGNITLGTVNGAQVFAINAGTAGTAQFGAVGASIPLTSLTATGATVTQASTVRATGAITYTGPTAINIGGNLTTAGGIVTWNNPAVLTTTLSVDTTNVGAAAAGANIVVGSVNAMTASISAEMLTLNAGTGGAVTLGTVGGSTPLGLLTISNATGVTATGNITMRGDATGGGTLSITQPVTLAAPATFTTTGGGVTAGNNITLGTVNGAQVFAINAGTSGTAQFGAIGGSTPLTSLTVTGSTTTQISTVRTTGAITYTGPTLINIGGNLTTAGGIVTWNNPATLANTLTVDTTNGGVAAAGANIVLGNVNATTTSIAAQQLTLNAGSGGAVTLGTVGGSTPLGLLTITGGTGVTAGGSITIRGNATGGGTISIAQPITLTASSTFTTTGGGITAGNNITLGTVNGAQVFAINAGTGGTAQFGAIGVSTPLTSITVTGATVAQTSTLRASGAVTYTGPTAINVSGNLTTAGGIVTWNNPATLANTLTVDTTNGGVAAAGANIVLGNVNATTTSIAAQQLTLNAGSGGAVTLGTVGGSTPLGLLTITGGTGVTSGGSITIRGNATGGGTISIAQPITLTASSTFTTTGGGINAGNNITLGTVNGAQVFAINAGTGGTAQFGAIGGSTPLTSLTVTGSTATQTSTVRTTGAITYTGPTLINIGGNLTTAGGIVTWNNPATITSTLTVDTTNAGAAAAGANIALGNVNATNATASAEHLTLNAGTGGAVTLGTVGGSTPLGLLTITGGTGVTAGGSITIRGNATAGGTLSISQPITLTAPATFATTGGGATAGNNITLGTVNGAQVFAINAGTGGTAQFAAIGGSTPVTSLSVTGATVAQTSTLRASGAISYTGPTAINVSGNLTTAGGIVTWNNPATLATTLIVDTTNAGVAAAGANIVLGNVNATTASVAAEQLTLNAGTSGAVTLGAMGGSTPLGLLSITGGTGVTAGGNITIRGDASGGGTLSISQPIILTGAATFTTTGGGVTAGNNVTLGTVNGAQVFAINAGTAGTAQFGAIGGSTPLTSLTATGATVNQTSTVRTTGAISYTGTTAIGIAGNLTTAGGSVTWNNVATLNATTQVDTTNSGGASGAAINLSTINAAGSGVQALTLNAGASTIAVSGAIGASSALNALTLTGNGGVSLNNIGAGGAGVTGSTAVTSTAGITLAGTVYNANAQTYTGPVILTASPTVTSSNDAISFTSNINGAGALTVNAGTSTVGVGGSIGNSTALSSLALTGNGGVTLGGIGGASAGVSGATSVTSSTSITFSGTVYNANAQTYTGPVLLTASPTISSSNDAISFTSTINGASRSLTVNAGSSTVAVGGVIGGTAALTALTITGNAGVTLLNIGGGSAGVSGAATVNSTTGITLNGSTYRTGSQAFNGPVNASVNVGFIGSTSIAFSSTFNGSVAVSATTSTGDVTFGGVIGLSTPLTTLTVNAGDVASIAAIGNSVTQGVSGAINLTAGTKIALMGTVYNTGQQTFNDRLTLGVDPSLISNNMPILFSGAIDGPELLSLNAGTSTVTIVGPIGATTPLPSIDITALGGVSIGNIGGVSQGVSGATTITTNVPINLTGTTYNAGTQTYGDDVNLSGSTTFTTHGGDLSFAGAIEGAAADLSLSLGGGALTLSGAIGGGSSIDDVTLSGFSTAQIAAITADSLTVTATSGSAFFNDPISLTGNATISVGSIFLSDTITAQNISITSQGSILNSAGPVALTAPGTIFLNALGGNIGSLASPIDVNNAAIITIGSSGIAYLTGSPAPSCVDYDFDNEPSAVFFNGSQIYNCNNPPPPPPPPAPSPSSTSTAIIIPRFFFVPGTYSTDNNFSTYPYNIPYLETWDVLNLSARMPPLYFGMHPPKKEGDKDNGFSIMRLWGL